MKSVPVKTVVSVFACCMWEMKKALIISGVIVAITLTLKPGK